MNRADAKCPELKISAKQKLGILNKGHLKVASNCHSHILRRFDEPKRKLKHKLYLVLYKIKIHYEVTKRGMVSFFIQRNVQYVYYTLPCKASPIAAISFLLKEM